MNTGGQMGVAVGVAAWLCKARGALPRGVYEKHLAELLDILNGRGRYAGALDPPAGAAAAAAAPAEASDVAVRTLALGLTRCTDRYEIVEVPEALRGLACVTAARGPTDAPGAAFAFEIDAPATVFLAVHDRGDAGLPAGWQPAEGEIRWTAGDRACTDRLYRRDFARGRVEVPPHTGREGPYCGVPHMAIVKAAEGAKVAVTPAARP